MKYLIIGQGKSGSSALFFAICKQVEDCLKLFEPLEMTREMLTEKENVVVKKLIEFSNEKEAELLDLFDKKLFLVRDPRDALISRLLYIVWDRKFAYDDDKLNTFVEAVQKKEQDPSSISVVELYDIMDKLDGVTVVNAVKRLNNMTLDYWNKHGADFEVFRYEDFIRGELDAVRKYLELPLENQVEVAKGVQRVSRKKSFGDWKNWFTPTDCEYFKQEFHEILELFGYNEDWELSPNPVLEPQFGSEYVRRIAMERREAHPIS